MNFTIYSKEGCPFCEKIQTILDYHNFNTAVYLLDVDFSREQFYDEFGEGSTFPQIVLDNINLGGCTETIKYLQENKICCEV